LAASHLTKRECWPQAAIEQADVASADREEGRGLSAGLAGAGRLLQRPITPDQLQAEMERMASHTKHSAVLREIFAAPANDPSLIGNWCER